MTDTTRDGRIAPSGPRRATMRSIRDGRELPRSDARKDSTSRGGEPSGQMPVHGSIPSKAYLRPLHGSGPSQSGQILARSRHFASRNHDRSVDSRRAGLIPRHRPGPGPGLRAGSAELAAPESREKSTSPGRVTWRESNHRHPGCRSVRARAGWRDALARFPAHFGRFPPRGPAREGGSTRAGRGGPDGPGVGDSVGSAESPEPLVRPGMTPRGRSIRGRPSQGIERMLKRPPLPGGFGCGASTDRR